LGIGCVGESCVQVVPEVQRGLFNTSADASADMSAGRFDACTDAIAGCGDTEGKKGSRQIMLHGHLVP
jgi:hypothetical protein